MCSLSLRPSPPLAWTAIRLTELNLAGKWYSPGLYCTHDRQIDRALDIMLQTTIYTLMLPSRVGENPLRRGNQAGETGRLAEGGLLLEWNPKGLCDSRNLQIAPPITWSVFPTVSFMTMCERKWNAPHSDMLWFAKLFEVHQSHGASFPLTLFYVVIPSTDYFMSCAAFFTTTQNALHSIQKPRYHHCRTLLHHSGGWNVPPESWSENKREASGPSIRSMVWW